MGRETSWEGRYGGDVDVNYCDFDLVYCNGNALVFGCGVASEEGICFEGLVWCILPDKEHEASPPVRAGSVPADHGVPPEVHRVGVGGQLGLLQAGHPDVVGGQELMEFLS